MKISYITANLNNGTLLRKSVESVLSQKDADTEVIIVDGGSSDVSAGDAAVLASGNPGKVLLETLPPTGVYDALNHGVKVATGEIIATLHGNDYLPNDRIAHKILSCFSSVQAPDIVYGDIYYVNPETGGKVRTYRADRVSPDSFRIGLAPPHTAVYIRKELYDKLGTYKPELRNAADFELLLRFFNTPGVSTRYIPEILAVMTTGGASTQLANMLFRNQFEKLKSLRINGITPDYPGFITYILKKILKK